MIKLRGSDGSPGAISISTTIFSRANSTKNGENIPDKLGKSPKTSE
jgi:hypothetical protein